MDESKPQREPFALKKPKAIGPIARCKALWAKRHVLVLLVRRDLRVRYADSILGYFWSILDPLMMGLVYWFVFTEIFIRRVGNEPYLLYLLAGMLPFRWFQTSVAGSVRAINGERLVRSTALPREIWVLRVMLSKGMEYVYSLPVLAIFAIAYRKGVSWDIFLMVPAMAIQIVLLTGLGLFLSAIGALARDVDRAVGIIMRFMFYATPIIYGLNDVLASGTIPKVLKEFYALNPMTGVISLYRVGFFAGEIHPHILIASIVGSVISLVAGWWVFIKLEPTVLKEI